SLLPGIWKNITDNARYRDTFRLFEIGMEIHRREQGLPEEIPHLVAALYDRQVSDANDGGIFELKRVAECLLPGARTVPTDARAYEHPARAAGIHWKGAVVGRLFELHPRFIENGRAAILDLDLRLVESLSADRPKYTPIRRYPSSAFDLSVIDRSRELAGTLKAAIAGDLADDDHIDAIDEMILQRGRIEQVFVAADGPQVGVDAHSPANGEQAAFGALAGRGVIELGQTDCAHEDRVGFEREFFGFGGKGRAGFVDGDPAEQAFAQGQLMAPLFRDKAQDTYGFAGDFGTDPVTGKYEDVQIQELISSGSCKSLLAAAREFGDLRVHEAFLIVREGSELRVNE